MLLLMLLVLAVMHDVGMAQQRLQYDQLALQWQQQQQQHHQPQPDRHSADLARNLVQQQQEQPPLPQRGLDEF